MARRTVRVDIPIFAPDKLITLCEKAIEKHTALEKNSPLKQSDMDLFSSQVAAGKSLHDQANKMHASAETIMEQARIKLGINEGQTVQTPGTAYFLITKIRDTLLAEHKGAEEALSEYGFNVVVGSVTPKGKAKA